MNGDPASLENLHAIVVPTPTPFWPPAPGWYVVLALAVILALVAGIWATRRFLRDAYRRAALAELKRAVRESADLDAVASILKRTALAAYPRAQVAGLSGDAWIQWLAETSGAPVPQEVAAALTRGVYEAPDSTDRSGVVAFIQRWIRRHKGRSPC